MNAEAAGAGIRGLKGSRAPLVVAAAICVAYVATRFLFIHRFPYFLDEGTYAVFSNRAAHATKDLFYSFTIGREPLMFWVGIPWIKLGVNPLVAVRVVSAIAGFLTLVCVGLLARRLGGLAAGLAAAALCVVLPFFLVHDGIGIIEPLVTLVMAAALYLQVEFARRPDLRVAVLLGLVLAAGMLTKENTKPALALLPLSLLCFDWDAPDRAERLKRWLIGVGIAAVMVVAALLLLRASSLYHLYPGSPQGPAALYRPPRRRRAAPPLRRDRQDLGGVPAAFGGYVTIPLNRRHARRCRARAAPPATPHRGPAGLDPRAAGGVDAVFNAPLPAPRAVRDAGGHRADGIRVR